MRRMGFQPTVHHVILKQLGNLLNLSMMINTSPYTPESIRVPGMNVLNVTQPATMQNLVV